MESEEINLNFNRSDSGKILLEKYENIDIGIKAKIINIVEKKGVRSIEILFTDRRWPILNKVPRPALTIRIPPGASEIDYVTKEVEQIMIYYAALGVATLVERRRAENEKK